MFIGRSINEMIPSSNKQSKDMKTKSRIFKTVMTIVSMMSFVTISCLLFQHCKKIDADVEYTLDVPKEYIEVGKTHNEGLDYIFAEIQKKCIEYTKESSGDPINSKAIDYPAIVREATIDFCRTNPKTKDNSELYEASILSSGSILKSSRVAEMEPGQEALIKEIQLALRTEYSPKNLKQLKVKLDIINKKAAQELSENDAAGIYCATSTAFSTFQYWKKNYRAWYFALNYPEIMGQLEKSELNKLTLKSSTSILDTVPDWRSPLRAFWDGYEGWINNMGDALDYWWDEYGEKVIVSDCLGAAIGTVDAVTAAGAPSLVFGPEGLVVVAAAGAIIGGIDASAGAITASGIIELINP